MMFPYVTLYSIDWIYIESIVFVAEINFWTIGFPMVKLDRNSKTIGEEWQKQAVPGHLELRLGSIN